MSAAQSPSDFNTTDLRAALGAFATGIIVVAVRDADGVARGLTVNSFASVSLDPPLISWCLGNSSDMAACFAASTQFTLNILAADQQALAAAMARAGGHELDSPTIKDDGAAIILSGSIAALACRVSERVAAGDHMIYLSAVTAIYQLGDAPPLLYFRGDYRALE